MSNSPNYLILNLEAKLSGVKNKLLENEMERKYMTGYRDGLEAAIDFVKRDLSEKEENK